MNVTTRPVFGQNASAGLPVKGPDTAIAAERSGRISAPISASQAAALKSRVMFGYSTHPKLTYVHEKTIDDPALGKIEVYRFSNGQELYAVRKTDVPLASFGILVKTGSYNEKERNNGVSHFLEHLIFKGTPNLAPGESERLLENLGAGVNAHTGEDQTFYFLYNIPKENLKESIRIQSELVQNAWIPQGELDRERGAVVEEIQMYADDKIDSTLEALNALIQGDNPYRRTILGPKKVIRTISRDDILEYYNRFYAPENRAVLVVGDFDLKEVLDTVASQLNKPFEAVKTRDNRKILKPSKADGEAVIKAPMNVAFTTLGFQGPDPSTADGARDAVALDLLSTVIGEGQSSRLNMDLFEDKGLAAMTGGYFKGYKQGSNFVLYAQTRPEKLSQAQEELENHVRRVVEGPVRADELEKAKNMLRRSLAENVETQIGQIMALEDAVIHGFDAELGNRLEIIDSMTPADLQKAAKKYLAGTAHRVSLVPNTYAGNKKEQAASPALRFSGTLDPVRDKRIQLSTGTELLIQERPGNMFTAITILARGGNRADSVTGETDLLAELLERGTRSRPMAEFQREMEANGISLEAGSEPDGVVLTMKGLSAKGLSAKKDKMYELLEDLLVNGPAVLDEDVAKIKERMIQDEEMEQDTNPRAVASSQLYEFLYPDEHPYGVVNSRIIQKFADLTPEILRRTFHRLFHPANITIGAVGDVSADEMREKAEVMIGRLPAVSETVSLRDATPPRLGHNRLVTRSKEDIEQSQVFRGWYAPSLTDADHAALKVLTTLLSGGLTSRFFQTFREKPEKALAYTVKATYQPKREGGALDFYIGTDHENLKRVIEMFEKEVNLLVSEPPSDEEMARAKLALKTQAVADSQKTDAESTYLSRHRGYEADSRIDLLPKVDAVTAQDIQAVARKILKKPSIISVVAPKEVLETNGFPVDAEGTFGFLEHSADGGLFTTRPANRS